MQAKITDTETKITDTETKSTDTEAKGTATDAATSRQIAQIKAHFATNLSRCLSVERLAEYDGSAVAHGANMAKIGELMPLLGTLEIALRNLADALVAARTGDAEWLCDFDDIKIAKTRADLAKNLSKTPRHSEILSNLTLGSWVFIIDHFRLAGAVFAGVELGRYSEHNASGSARRLSRVQAARACAKLLLCLRNRAAHFENLAKMRGEISRISANIDGICVDVHPSRLQDFVRDLIANINAELLATLPEKFR